MEQDKIATAFVVILVVALIAYRWGEQRNQLEHIPTFGSDSLFASYLTALRYLKEAPVVLQEAYDMYKGRVFRIPQLSGWLVIVTGDTLVDELRLAPEQVLSLEAAANDILQLRYTVGRETLENTFHADIMRHTMNKNLSNILPDAIDEIGTALSDEIDTKLSSSDWTSLKVDDVFLRVVCRSSNRTFVGLPLCRVKEYCSINIQFAINVLVGAFFLNRFPDFMKPMLGAIFTTVSGSHRKVLKHLRPLIEHRKAKIAQHGPEYPEKPNDLLSWLMDVAPPEYSSTESLAHRLMSCNFVAVHTTSTSFLHALYHLASKPSYAEALRDEVLSTMGTDPTGWTHKAFDACWKLDSFLKESARLSTVGALSFTRKAMRTYTFRDGTVIPEGTTVAVAQTATHRDEAYYPNAAEFDAFRFSRLREAAAGKQREGGDDAQGEGGDWRHRLTGTGLGFLPFGGGRHACPGRFFAALELKCMMAYILLRYDVKMADEGVRPRDQWFGPLCIPGGHANVLFRRRA